MTIIKLKRTRNSLLNVSTLPPEILGEIFRHSTALKANPKAIYSSWVKRSYNFLLVCHHWFEVASHAPELWGFWGHNPQDWVKRYLQYPTAPLNLVLDDEQSNSTSATLDDGLRSALQTRAMQDTIQQIRLASRDSGILNSIISSLTGHEGIRSSSVELVDLQFNHPREPPIVSGFLAHYRFPKLQRLDLGNCIIPSWDLKTSALTRLHLDSRFPSPMITSPQILSILRSNPLLRELALGRYAVPDDGGDESSRVPLAHLRVLRLSGRPRDVFTLLHRLDCPTEMVSLTLDLADSRVEDISRLIGPYLRDYLQRRGSPKTGLGVWLFADEGSTRLATGDTTDFSARGWDCFSPFIKFSIELGRDQLEEDFLNLIAFVPREEITCFQAYNVPISMEVICTQFPSLKGIHFEPTSLDVAFPQLNPDRDNIFPSIQFIRIVLSRNEIAGHADWESLINFLDHFASSGNRLDTLELEIYRSRHGMDPEAEERIRRAVRELRTTDYDEY